MEIEPIQRYGSLDDEVYYSFIIEYGKYIPTTLDEIFTDLMNNVQEYNIYHGNYINLVKNDLKRIGNIDVLDTLVNEEYIDFNGTGEVNLRLSMLLPKIVKLRQIAYKKTYDLASVLVLEEVPDFRLYENYILASDTIKELSFENFYADLRIYNTEETISRFYDEALLIDIVCNALNGKDISLEEVNTLEHNLYKIHTNIFNYLKERYVRRNKTLEMR